MITLHTLTKTNDKKKLKRVGRGLGSGKGKTAGRGTKGQKSRTGYTKRFNLPNLPKLRGFKSRAQKPVTLNWLKIKDKFKASEKISIKKLINFGLIKKGQRFKIVGRSTK